MSFKYRLFAVATSFITLAACANGALPNSETTMMFEARGGQSVDAMRGSLMVPENRSDPESRMIRIEYVRFPATGDVSGSPIVYLSGGPGGSGIGTAKGPRFPLFMAMRAFGDVIALDQRGTGASNDLPNCESSQIDPDETPISDAEHLIKHKLAADECLAFWETEGVDIRGYTTRESVADLDDLRKHLGAEKISLWGISYGSHLSLAALKEMDDRIDRVVLASIAGLDQTAKLPARTDAYFDRLQATLNQAPDMRAQFPDIKALISRVHTKLDANPIMLDVPLQDGSTAPFLLERRDLQQPLNGRSSALGCMQSWMQADPPALPVSWRASLILEHPSLIGP